MLTKPIVNDIRTFDARESNIISFQVIGGNQIVGNTLVVEDVKTGAIAYSNTVSSLVPKHMISRNQLENGKTYRLTVKTFDKDGNESQVSESRLFSCYSIPVLIVENLEIESQVNNQTVVFSTRYEQLEEEPLQSYRYSLYDANTKLISTFPDVYTDGSDKLEQEVTGLSNGSEYFIRVETMSPNGNIGDTGLIKFSVLYLTPNISVALEPENIFNEGAISIKANIVQIYLKVYDVDGNELEEEEVEYVNKDWIDMNKYNYLSPKSGFQSKSGDYIFKIWLKNLPNGVEFLSIDTYWGHYTFARKEEYYIGKMNKGVNGATGQQFISNRLPSWGYNDEVMLVIKSESGLLNLGVERVV